MPKEPVLQALNNLNPLGGGSGMRVMLLFGDQPDVLDAIVEARKRRCSFVQIAKAISTPEASVSDSAVKKFLMSRGID
jgi:hypothetical protein